MKTKKKTEVATPRKSLPTPLQARADEIFRSHILDGAKPSRALAFAEYADAMLDDEPATRDLERTALQQLRRAARWALEGHEG